MYLCICLRYIPDHAQDPDQNKAVTEDQFLEIHSSERVSEWIIEWIKN